jgi:hypothetical protein
MTFQRSIAMVPDDADRLGRKPTAEGLQSFLEYLSRQRYASGVVFETEALPMLLDYLGYPPDNVYFQPIVRGEARDRFDAIVARTRTSVPWLVIEAKLQPPPGIVRDWVQRLPQLRYRSRAHAAVLFTPETLAVSTADNEAADVFDLRRATASVADVIFGALRAPDSLPSEPIDFSGSGATAAPAVISSEHAKLRQQYEVLDTTETNKAKGDALEVLAKSLMDGVPGLKVVRSKLRTSSSEIDLVVEVTKAGTLEMFHEFGRYILVECKNWDDPVQAKDIRDFVGKVVKTKTRLGILFARNGITGLRDSSAALREIQLAFDGQDIFILIVTDADLRAVVEGNDFATILAAKSFDLRFDM